MTEQPPQDPNSTPEDDGRVAVQDMTIDEEMRRSYMQYAMSVITSRALPDIRDGLKPSQRRVIFAMQQLRLGTPGAKRVKSARVVGETMGRYHPHGDQSIYMTLVRMAQPFASRYTMVDPKGNFGSVANPSPAAMRYTECRMARPAADMVADIDQRTVDMKPTYDNETLEPVVLPSRFPNLLCNGAQGIAVGMATSIPPHNLNEVVDGLVALVQNPEITLRELMEHIPGPDFPTRGVICGRSGVRQAYEHGRGSVVLRGKAEIREAKRGRSEIVVTELPYQVTTENFKEKIQEAHSSKRVQGLADIRDQSGGNRDVYIVLPCKKGEDPNIILNQLYKHTPLQSTFSIIMIALEPHEHGFRPRTFGLKGMLEAFVAHRYEVIRRRTLYQLEKCRERIEILEGLVKALDKIDEVIATIRGSSSTEDARDGLRELLGVNVRQANAILDMRLQRLVAMERDKTTQELEEQQALAKDLTDILQREERVRALFIEDMEDLKRRYGKNDLRRTAIDEAEFESIEEEDLIAVEDAVITVTHKGYIKRTALTEYRVQQRAGKGLYGASTRDDDFVTEMFQASTKDYVLCFTSNGRVHWIKVYRIPEGTRTARGRGIRNLIALLPDESVTSLIPIKGEFSADRFLVMATAKGVIKKTALSSFSRPRKAGVIGVKLDAGDQLVGVRVTNGGDQLVLASRRGKAIRFHEETVRAMGRSARGVRGIDLGAGDELVSLVKAGEEGPLLLTACELGYGKRTPVEDYRETNRGGKGIINIKVTPRNGYVAGVVAVKPGDQVILITTSGKLIRISADDVSSIGRNTQGVRIIRVDSDEKVVALAKVVVDDSVDAEPEAPPPSE